MPWYIKEVTFDAEAKRLDIHIDFEKCTKFHYESLEEGISVTFPRVRVRYSGEGVAPPEFLPALVLFTCLGTVHQAALGRGTEV